MPETTETQGATKLILVSEHLWMRLKVLAAQEQTTMREITDRAIERELKRTEGR